MKYLPLLIMFLFFFVRSFAEIITVSDLINGNGSITQMPAQPAQIDFTGYSVVLDPTLGPVFHIEHLQPGWNAVGNGLNGEVAVIVSDGANLYVGGQFTNAGGLENADRIARWDGNAWHALGTGLNSRVRTIAIKGSDVFVGGLFTDAGNQPNGDHIAKWDGNSWQPLQIGFESSVNIIVVHGNDLYAGGSFDFQANEPNARGIARWDGTTWHALGDGLSNRFVGVNTIVFDNSRVIVGGEFSINDEPEDRHLAVWDGTGWEILGGDVNGKVNDMVLSGGDLYVGGSFEDAGGISEADGVARWDGFAWHALGNGISIGSNDRVNDLIVVQNVVYAAGAFTNAGGNANADYLAVWDGTHWQAFNPPLNGSLSTILLEGNNLYVGGIFTNAGGNLDSDRIARWEGALVNSSQPTTFEIKPLYPNPTSGILYLPESHPAISGVRIFDSRGVLVYKQSAPVPTNKIDITHFTAGVYLIELSTCEASIRTTILKI